MVHDGNKARTACHRHAACLWPLPVGVARVSVMSKIFLESNCHTAKHCNSEILHKSTIDCLSYSYSLILKRSYFSYLKVSKSCKQQNTAHLWFIVIFIILQSIKLKPIIPPVVYAPGHCSLQSATFNPCTPSCRV